VREEFEAPVDAIMGYAESMLEDAEQRGLHAIQGDLRRLRDAGSKLEELVAGRDNPVARDQDFAAFGRDLRHDLRTPIGAIKGFGEMLLDDAEAAGNAAQARALEKLLAATARLLVQVDALADFNLPSPDAAPETPAEDALAAAAEAGSSRILIVDDMAETRELLSRRLMREGHRVVEAENGRSALARVAAETFDLILLDLMMPDISGYEVLRQLKASPRHRHIPVIVISALDEIDNAVRCIEAGAEDYLTKPFDPVLLHARVGASLEKRQLRDREQALNEAMSTSLRAQERRLQEALAATKSEIAQLHDTIIALRQQLDAVVLAAKARADDARASAAAEIHQLRATCEALRGMLEAEESGRGPAASPRPEKQASHGR